MILGGTCIFLALILIVGVCTIPFVFESSSIYYKFGIHKTLLRTGKVFGMIIAFLTLMHPILILGSENFTLFPFEIRYWPELLGAVVWLCL
mgnify:CR=1 FL=1|jgi:hypothetical protein